MRLLLSCHFTLVQKRILTTEAQRTQRKPFVCREVPTNKNILSCRPVSVCDECLCHAFHLRDSFRLSVSPDRRKINNPLRDLRASVVNLILGAMNLLRNTQQNQNAAEEIPPILDSNAVIFQMTLLPLVHIMELVA